MINIDAGYGGVAQGRLSMSMSMSMAGIHLWLDVIIIIASFA